MGLMFVRNKIYISNYIVADGSDLFLGVSQAARLIRGFLLSARDNWRSGVGMSAKEYREKHVWQGVGTFEYGCLEDALK